MDFDTEFTLSRVRLMGDPVLSSRCPEIDDFGDETIGLADQLIDGLRAEKNGIGLAANQIGIRARAFSYDLRGTLSPNDQNFHGVVFNPLVVEGDGGSYFNEGCLSIPGLYWDIYRPERIHVKGFSSEGEELEFELDGLASRLFQHEIDHLDGLLIFDRMKDPAEKREALLQASVLLESVRGERNQGEGFLLP